MQHDLFNAALRGGRNPPPGFVVLYRYLEAPHPKVSFQGDFSKRLSSIVLG